MMLDLFDAPIIPGLRSQSDMISQREEAALIEAIDAQDRCYPDDLIEINRTNDRWRKPKEVSLIRSVAN
jgi:hypothetical protein